VGVVVEAAGEDEGSAPVLTEVVEDGEGAEGV
jgi:hypothetical protein